jgi:asparagine synthase (glutamine-hydrolysing)
MSGIYVSSISLKKDEIKAKFSKLTNVKTKISEYKNLLIGSFISSYSELANEYDLDSDYFANEKFCICFQGVVYNLDEIIRLLTNHNIRLSSDKESEIILKGYEVFGERILERINGLFVLTIFDSQKNILLCARDRFGVKPCYYSFINGKIEICSRLQPLINDNSRLSDESIAYFLNYGYIPTPLAVIKDVKKIHPGHYLIVDLSKNEIKELPYWDLKSFETNKISYDDAKTELHDLIVDAVKIRIGSNKNIGTFLSGGIDSSIVSSILAKQSNSQISSYTIAFDENNYDERAIAKKYSEIIGTKHHEFTFKPKDCLKIVDQLVEVYDEPFADSSALPTLFLNLNYYKNSSIAFTGDGGDENFLAYGQFSPMQKFDKLLKVPFFIRNNIGNYISNKRLQNILKTSDSNTFMDICLYGSDGYLLNDKSLLDIDKYYAKYKKLSNSSVQNLADFSIKYLWDNGYNVKVERASSAYSINLRSPLLDYRIVEYARCLPINYRLDGNNGKKILKDILELYIPKNIFNQPKKGFSMPLGSWIKNSLKEEVMDNIALHHEKRFNYFNNNCFSTMLSNHMLGLEDNSLYIWRVYILNKWIQKYNL